MHEAMEDNPSLEAWLVLYLEQNAIPDVREGGGLQFPEDCSSSAVTPACL